MQRLTIIMLFLLGVSFAYAQPDLETDEVEVIKNFEAQLAEANKLNVQPTLPTLDTNSYELSYAIPTQYLELDYPAPTIKPIAMRAEQLPPKYDGYAKIGYGTPNSIYGNLAYRRKVNDNLRVGGELLHHSANNDKNIENQRFSTSGGRLDGVYYFLEQGFAVAADIGFREDNRYFYGYDDEQVSFAKDDVRQRFRTFDFGTRFFNAQRTNGDLNYFADIDLYRLTDYYDSDETGFDMQFGLTKYFNEKHPLSVVLRTDFTNFNPDEAEKQDLHNFSLKPTFGYHADRFKVDVGVNVLSHDDEFTFYPDIEATVNILGSRLAAFAGWEGDFNKNTFQSLTQYNPYLVSTGLDIKNTSYQEFYGGVKGRIDIIEYNGEIGYKDANDLALFVVNQTDSTRFDVLYDTVNIINIEGTVDLHLMKDLTLGGSIRSNIFDPNFQEKPWGLPSFETNVAARYRMLSNKLLLKADWFTANGIPYIRYDGNGDTFADNLNTLFDVNIGAEYWVHQNIGIFADVNNLFGNKRERWQNYPQYGLNVLFGLTGRF